MCGIVGVFSATPFETPTHVTELMAHRGPDGQGELRVGGAWLGHRRLAIIDLSESGAQPMRREGVGSIVFNGEIYDHANHRAILETSGEHFLTESDTEVLLLGLSRHGPGFLRGLHGMYALAWVAPGEQSITLARDHLGIKPLYYWANAEKVVFASEIRTLAAALRHLRVPVSLSATGLGGFLAWGSIPEPGTMLEGVRCLPADTALTFSLGSSGALARREVSIGTLDGNSPAVPEADVVHASREAMSNAIRRHLVSDVPVALFLSAGLDSGVLAAEVSRSPEMRPTALTVVLQTRGTDEEPEIAARFAGRLGLELKTIPADGWRGCIEDALDAYDQPSVDGLNTYVISRFARQSGFTVALSGLGGDEIFGGYAHFRSRARPLGMVPAVIGAGVSRLCSGRGFGTPFRRAAILTTAREHGEPPQVEWRRMMTDHEVADIMPGVAAAHQVTPTSDPLELERDTYLRNTLLRDTDVMGMAHGLEIRAPFLDPEVVRLSKRIGSRRLLSRDRPPKWVLRDGWANDLDAAALSRPKTGFTIDVASWLRSEGAEILRQALADLPRRPGMNAVAIEKLGRRGLAALETRHPAAWVPLLSLIQLDRVFQKWGDL